MKILSLKKKSKMNINCVRCEIHIIAINPHYGKDWCIYCEDEFRRYNHRILDNRNRIDVCLQSLGGIDHQQMIDELDFYTANPDPPFDYRD